MNLRQNLKLRWNQCAHYSIFADGKKGNIEPHTGTGSKSGSKVQNKGYHLRLVQTKDLPLEVVTLES